MGHTPDLPSRRSFDILPAEKNNKRQKEMWRIKPSIIYTIPPLLILLFVFVLVEWLTDGQPSRTLYWSIQRDWFFALNLALSDGPRLFWSTLTLLGDGMVLLPVLSFLIVRKPPLLGAILGAVPVAAAFSVIIKHLLAIPRPAAVLENHLFTIIGSPLRGDNSFPSGHCISVFTVAIAILATLIPSPQKGRQWILLLSGLSIASAVCLSRVAVGAHWPLDLFVGAACGWIAGLSGVAVARRWPWHWNQSLTSCRIIGAVLLVWSLFIMSRAFTAAPHEIVFWPSALCGMAASMRLLKTRPISLT